MIEFTLETITPKQAAEILAQHDDAVAAGEITNRPRTRAAITKYAADLLSKSWYSETGETLKFSSRNGLHGSTLVDGQNRLAACLDANVPLTVYVARGVAREAYQYIDGGEKRSLRHALRSGRVEDADLLARTLPLVAQWDVAARKFAQSPISTQRALRLLTSDPQIHRSILRAKPIKDSRLLTVPVAAFLHRIFSDDDRTLADDFISALSTGTGLVAGDPFLVLREVLIANKGSRRKLQQKDLIVISIKAWNYKRLGRSIKYLRLNRGESFPVLADVVRQED